MTRNRFPIAAVAATVIALAGFTLFGCSDDDDDDPGPGPNPSGFDSGLLTAPAQYVRTFSSAGVINYHCNPHRSMGMTGTITVVDGASDSVVVTASGMVFSPASVSIKPGGYVRWAITGGTHSVTQD